MVACLPWLQITSQMCLWLLLLRTAWHEVQSSDAGVAYCLGEKLPLKTPRKADD